MNFEYNSPITDSKRLNSKFKNCQPSKLLSLEFKLPSLQETSQLNVIAPIPILTPLQNAPGNQLNFNLVTEDLFC